MDDGSMGFFSFMKIEDLSITDLISLRKDLGDSKITAHSFLFPENPNMKTYLSASDELKLHKMYAQYTKVLNAVNERFDSIIDEIEVTL